MKLNVIAWLLFVNEYSAADFPVGDQDALSDFSGFFHINRTLVMNAIQS